VSDLTAEDLSVIIPTRDRWPILRRTLDGLRRQTVQGFEVVVVVDGTDQVIPELPGATVITKPHGGPGAARNAGVAAAQRPLVLLLGDDMVPTPDLVAHHLRRHRQDPAPTTAVLGHVEWHPDVARSRLLRWLDWSGTQFEFHSIEGDEAGYGHFYSCNTSLTRELYQRVGGFDEDFVYYYEDLDVGRRLHDAGMRLLYERDAVAHHLHSYRWEDVVRRFQGVARGERMMAAKHSWFTPYFRERTALAAAAPRRSRAWTWIADVLPTSAGKARSAVRRRANTWYYQQLEPAFATSWEGDQALAELKAYLGEAYDERRLREHVHEVEAEEEAAPDETTFYRTSEAYLYDLTVFAMSGTKAPYVRDLRRFVPPGARLLDYGCGIGSDGLPLLEAGYRVSFADFDNPSTRYLRWRLQRRGLDAPVHDVEAEGIPTDFDAVYCFDVIEHIDDPFAFLATLERHGRIVAINFLEPEPNDTHLHKPLPIGELLDHATDNGLLHYRRYHGRSHLVIYRTTGVGTLGALRSRVKRTVSAHR
jgi:GT2 family glycosyltransferase/2-polyprenyl-3-methyl-5-hydroxy-6-metoxy-1,4-benzoquinol methylase